MARKGDAEYRALVKEYKSLAKKADQRLVRLEKLSKKSGFENVEKWAYNRAMKDIQYWSGSKATRFNRDIPTNKNSLKARISDVKNFLSAKTSTKSGILKTYKQRSNMISKKYGVKMSWEKTAEFFESKEWENLDKEYGSDTAMRALGEIQKNEDKIKKAIENHKPVSMRIKNEKVAEAVNSILEEQGLSILEMI